MTPPQIARRLFAPIAPSYERWAAILSLGQDSRWRRTMVAGLRLPGGASVLDVASGTGSIARLLRGRGWSVQPLDQSLEMLSRQPGSPAVAATAEQLPFADKSFDGVTFGYLLRYVGDVPACLTELARVTRPGGAVGMVEFGRPDGLWRFPWRIYTRGVLPLAGRLIGHGWHEVGSFLWHSIEAFHDTWPVSRLVAAWEAAGFDDVQVRRPSLGGGLVMWGMRR